MLTPLTATTITEDHLKALFMAHCECRPLDLWRTRREHSHDCDLDILDDIRKAGGWLGVIESACQDARLRCVDYWNADLVSAIYAPLLDYAWTTLMDNGTAASDDGRRV